MASERIQQESLDNVKEIFSFGDTKKLKLPLFTARISAGFPSPADDFTDQKLDLNELLIRHPAATFFVRVFGDSMTGAGIHDKDLLIVDRALEATDKKIIIAVLNGELTVKRLRHIKNKTYLLPENKNYTPIEVTAEMDFEVWGVVTNVVHSCLS